MLIRLHKVSKQGSAWALASVLFCVSLSAAEAPAAEPELVRLHPCKVDGIESQVFCATYVVWENRAAKAGRKIPIHVVVLPALEDARKVAPDPIFYLAGGPGQAATSIAAGFAQAKDLRTKRDLVFVDQRGTGGSNGLDCDWLGKPANLAKAASQFAAPEDVAACRKELEKRADLSLYTTELAIDDIEDVRAWLGYGPINVMGGSYGTTAAQVYLKRHPESIRTLVLDGVAPIDEPYPLHHASAGQAAAERLFSECAADAACKAAFPNVAQELNEVMARVERGVEVEIQDPATKKLVKVRPNRGVVADGLRLFLYGTEEDGKNTFPLRIHQAFGGDLRPLVEAAVGRSIGLQEILYEGLWLSVTCAEDIPRIDPSLIEKETKGTFLGDFRVRVQQKACELWPRGQVSPTFWDLPKSKVPTLLISGERDPVTPPSFGERVAQGLENGLHLVVPHGGHGADSECVNGITVSFLDKGSAQGLDTSCLAKSPVARFATEVPSKK